MKNATIESSEILSLRFSRKEDLFLSENTCTYYLHGREVKTMKTLSKESLTKELVIRELELVGSDAENAGLLVDYAKAQHLWKQSQSSAKTRKNLEDSVEALRRAYKNYDLMISRVLALVK